jgi:putative peptidoglycan lipid II flippase
MLQFAHVGLALATALSAALNAGLLYQGLRKDGVYQPRGGWMRFALKLLLPNLGLVMTLYWLNPNLTQWLAASGWERSLMLLGIIAAAAAVYFVLLHLVGIRIRQLLKPMPADLS